MIDLQKIRLAFYYASDGPRLMLFGPMEMNLGPLLECFRRLGESECEFELSSLSFIHSKDVRLRLESVSDSSNTEPEVGAVGIQQRGSERSYVWLQSNTGWIKLGELVEGLIQSQRQGHQYLSRYPDEDAIVVVSKGEYSDDVLSED